MKAQMLGSIIGFGCLIWSQPFTDDRNTCFYVFFVRCMYVVKEWEQFSPKLFPTILTNCTGIVFYS